jgi:c-di-GMP-binding flagellar brake protein YcgR
MMERRNYPRSGVSHFVLYFSDIYPRPRVASTLDLSLGGTGIKTSYGYGLVRGERLEISIAIPPQAITCRGKAIYVVGPEDGRMKAGIEFEELSTHDKLHLKQYLSHATEQRV